LKASYIFFLTFSIVFLKRKIVDKLIKNNKSDVFTLPIFLNKLLILILRIEAYFLKYIDFPIGSSLIIIAKKIK